MSRSRCEVKVKATFGFSDFLQIPALVVGFIFETLIVDDASAGEAFVGVVGVADGGEGSAVRALFFGRCHCFIRCFVLVIDWLR